MISRTNTNNSNNLTFSNTTTGRTATATNPELDTFMTTMALTMRVHWQTIRAMTMGRATSTTNIDHNTDILCSYSKSYHSGQQKYQGTTNLKNASQ